MGYRFSDEFIKRWERRLVGTLCVGVAAAFALAGGGILIAQALGLEEFDSTTSWIVFGVVVFGLAVGAATVVGTVFTAAIMGGQSLHRLGWIPGLLLATWLFGGIALYPALGGGLGFLAHLAGFVPIVMVFIRLGRSRAAQVENAD